ncbi:MAG: hypothetical protein ACYTF0_06760 [Planctomycetota bacterium]|jgi:hypothetical protein
MSGFSGLPDQLEAAGFTVLEVADSPGQVRWYGCPRSWRERLPVVRGYRRVVALIDCPLASGERLRDISAEVASLVAGGALTRSLSAIPVATPWWAYPLVMLAFVVALAATAFAGLSLELEDHDWCLIVVRGDRLADEAAAAIDRGAGAGERFVALTGLYDDRARKLVIPALPRAVWGRQLAVAQAALRDLRVKLRSLLVIGGAEG